MDHNTVVVWGVGIVVQVFIIGIALFLFKKMLQVFVQPHSVRGMYITYVDHEKECKRVQDAFRELLGMKVELLLTRIETIDQVLGELRADVKELRQNMEVIKASLDNNEG